MTRVLNLRSNSSVMFVSRNFLFALLFMSVFQVDPSEDEPTGFFFASDDALTNTERLVVIMHGSGVVRAGQWARRQA